MPHGQLMLSRLATVIRSAQVVIDMKESPGMRTCTTHVTNPPVLTMLH
jgi:hypothetical protein